MPAKHHTAIDDRGYFFCLPSLGLPDSAGEWVTIRGAIGPMTALPRIKVKLGSAAAATPLRTPPASGWACKSIDLEGAVWLLPKSEATSAPNSHSLELFTVKVWRTPSPSAAPPQKGKTAGQDILVCLEDSDWPPLPPANLNAKQHKASTSSRSRPGPPACNSNLTAAELDIGRDFTDGELMTGGTFTSDFLEEVMLVHGKEPKILMGLQATESDSEDFRGLTYAVRRKGDLSNVRDDDWRPLPWYAMEPGMQRYEVNVCRQVLVGKGPLPGPPTGVEDG